MALISFNLNYNYFLSIRGCLLGGLCTCTLNFDRVCTSACSHPFIKKIKKLMYTYMIIIAHNIILLYKANQNFKHTLTNLHSYFAISRALPLKEYWLTRNKVKDILVIMRPKLTWIISKYELSSAGAGQRDEGDVDYGRVDLTQCAAGDDR